MENDPYRLICDRLEERCQSTLERSSQEAEAARVEEERRLAKQCEAAAQLRYRQELEAIQHSSSSHRSSNNVQHTVLPFVPSMPAGCSPAGCS